MSALDLLQYLSWLLYMVVFVSVLLRAIRHTTPAHVDMALFFGATALIIVASTITSTLNIQAPVWLSDATGTLLVSLAYLQLRLVNDFSDVPTWLLRASELGLALSVAAIVILPTPLPAVVALLIVLYFVLLVGYETLEFLRESRRTRGVTRRRMQAAAAGSGSLALLLVVAGVHSAAPGAGAVAAWTSAIMGLASGVFYFVGFAPPAWLRRAWQEPELRAFLSRTAGLSRLADLSSVVVELERGAAASLGAQEALIALWDTRAGRLRFPTPLRESNGATSFVTREPAWELESDSPHPAARAFNRQRAELFTGRAAAAATPADEAGPSAAGARAALAAPITIGGKRLGVLLIMAPRAPTFATSDLELVQLLADQAAVVLENRDLIENAARVQAREEATRLKDDFLSSAAHDLKTPLTGLVTQAQLLRRRADRDPTAPADVRGLDRILEQSLRLRDLVLELLDVSRLERGSLLGVLEQVDLRELVRTALERVRELPGWERVAIEAPAPVPACVDRLRVEQVVTNLVENALKYSPPETRVEIRIWSEGQEARMSVRDEGIGIPFEDQQHVFDRFHRAANVDDRRFAGMGLGLYITRAVVEQHGGRVWFVSQPGAGSTFDVALPAVPPPTPSVNGVAPEVAVSVEAS